MGSGPGQGRGILDHGLASTTQEGPSSWTSVPAPVPSKPKPLRHRSNRAPLGPRTMATGHWAPQGATRSRPPPLTAGASPAGRGPGSGTGPGPDQGSVHTEVLVRQQALRIGPPHHLVDQGASRVVRQQPLPVLGEGVEAAPDQAPVQEPAERQVAAQLLAEGALAAHRVQGNQQRGLGSRAGGTEARPTLTYMLSNAGDRRARAASVTALSRRRGWSFGTRFPGPLRPVSYVGRWVDRAGRGPPDWMTPVLAEGVSEQSAVAVMIVATLASHASRQLGVPRSWITEGPYQQPITSPGFAGEGLAVSLQ